MFAGGWIAHNPGDEGGPHLYLINDALETGAFQNVQIDAHGYFYLIDEVETFNLSLDDLHPHNSQAELLTSYGPQFHATAPGAQGGAGPSSDNAPLGPPPHGDGRDFPQKRGMFSPKGIMQYLVVF